ncbi:guanylate cyclase soluble subunit beta-1-like isoform X2 [Hydractinia symbiolongicarpus]|uniref:guanylate cyclase soluble subunit beta-1-like isoform X2 n=1 Tax=Hydractinia symbiolongicarpus TaxID=13093 RepID=UPI002550D675|nr:guanylate cyclase soluble subunit beta-1-like isoform X2 [Hydractinia symbiolongicarpus]
MYGFFNHALERFIIMEYGEEKWEVIRMEAGVFEDSFDGKMVYDDNMIFEILDAACEVLDTEQEDLQEEFGEAYFMHCLASHHGKLLKALGGNLYDFLSNVDSLHDHLAVSYAGVKVPTFRVKSDGTNRSISVNYYSDRVGLEYVTKGVIRMAAKELFGLEVIVESICDIDAFKFLVTTENPDDCHLMFPKSIESSRDLIPRANEPKVSPLEFTKVFPFHMLFDRNMKLLQVGSTLKRILKDLNNKNSEKNSEITTYFTLSRPQIPFDFESIYSRLNNVFILTSLKDVVKATPSILHMQSSNDTTPRRTNLRLKGQMIFLDEAEAMLFLCSPSVSNIEDMRNKGLCLSDIPIHDATRDLVLLSENFQKELELTHQLGIVSDHLQKIHTELEEEMHLYDRLLFAVLPTTIARDLRESKQIPTEKFESVTLMFSGIVDFTRLCEDLEPLRIVNMLNELYTKFDVLVDFMATYVYKVETVGDKYMTASGLPERCLNHPQVICTLALDMLDATREVKINGKDIQVTFGIHSGEVVAGVIGQRMPRYCLFGNAVNLTSRTETTGLKGEINVTEETFKLLSQSDISNNYEFTKRGKVAMKGKSEPMLTYTLSRPVDRSQLSKASMFLSQEFQPAFLSIHGLGGSESGSPVLTGSGAVTLNRNRCNSGNSNMRRSRNASVYASRFNTPGASKNVSRYATPLRSRCNSAVSTAPYIPSNSNNQKKYKVNESAHVNIGNRLDLLEERSPISLSPTSTSPQMNHADIENILKQVNKSLHIK